MTTKTARLEMARELSARLKALVGEARAAEAKVAVALLEMKRRGLFRCLGYSRIQDYAEAELARSRAPRELALDGRGDDARGAERQLDLRKSKTKDLIEIASRIETLPATRAAFEKGDLGWTKARQVIRVATPETEEEWLHKARSSTNRELESAVAQAKGEPPVERIVLGSPP